MCFCKLFRWGRKTLNDKPKDQLPEKYGKRTKKLIWKNENRDIGVTYLELTFESGKKLNKAIYGYISQYEDSGSDYSKGNSNVYSRELKEPVAGDFFIQTSKEVAQHYLSHLPQKEATYVNDEFYPTISRVGKVVYARLLESEEYFRDVSVAYVVPKEEGDK